MSKIEGLQTLRDHIEQTNEVWAHILVLHPLSEPENRLDRLRHIGERALLLAELDDHLHNLSGIVAACRHGLAGNVPDDYSPNNYGLSDTSTPYDPYATILEHLGAEDRVSVLQLSPALLAFIEGLPEWERSSSATLLDFFGKATWQPDPVTGKLRPLTEEETKRWPESSMMKSIEQTFFAIPYAEDMAKALTLTEARCDLQQILDLAR